MPRGKKKKSRKKGASASGGGRGVHVKHGAVGGGAVVAKTVNRASGLGGDATTFPGLAPLIQWWDSLPAVRRRRLTSIPIVCCCGECFRLRWCCVGLTLRFRGLCISQQECPAHTCRRCGYLFTDVFMMFQGGASRRAPIAPRVAVVSLDVCVCMLVCQCTAANLHLRHRPPQVSADVLTVVLHNGAFMPADLAVLSRLADAREDVTGTSATPRVNLAAIVDDVRFQDRTHSSMRQARQPLTDGGASSTGGGHLSGAGAGGGAAVSAGEPGAAPLDSEGMVSPPLPAVVSTTPSALTAVAHTAARVTPATPPARRYRSVADTGHPRPAPFAGVVARAPAPGGGPVQTPFGSLPAAATPPISTAGQRAQARAEAAGGGRLDLSDMFGFALRGMQFEVLGPTNSSLLFQPRSVPTGQVGDTCWHCGTFLKLRFIDTLTYPLPIR